MKYKVLLVLLTVVLLFNGCNIGDTEVTMPTPTPAKNTDTVFNTMGITPNITQEPTVTPIDLSTPTSTPATPSPAPADTATPQYTPIVPTPDAGLQQRKQEINEYLPALDTTLRFYGIAESGHYGQLSEVSSSLTEAKYVFNGTYDDGMGVPDEFEVEYFINYERGTVTEKAGYNERLDKNEFNSKLHNIVVLKFPLSLGTTWGHYTKINGNKYWVEAEVIEYNSNNVKVIYTAEGVPDYYDNTYFEMRTYEKGYGMTSFGNIMPGPLDMTGVDTSDEVAVRDHIMNMYMFGYSLIKD